MNRLRLLLSYTILALCLVPLVAAPVSAQQIPANIRWEQLTPQQQEMLLRRLQQSQTGQLTGLGQEGLYQLPGTLLPQADTSLAVMAVDTTEVPPPEITYDFALSPDELDTTITFQLFGRKTFREAPLDFAPSTYGPVGADYRLGPGDEVVIQLWGTYDDIITQTITREGYIFLPKVGQVMLASRTREEAKRYLLQRMTPFYEALNYGRADATASLDVSIGRLRGVRVFVLGNVVRPGAYTLSSTSMIFTALYAAGGPDELGNLRDIRLIRGTREVAHLDGYDYLTRGDPSSDVQLEDNDIVYVPSAAGRVLVQGKIQRPAIYDLKAGDTLEDLIAFAGGLTPAARLDQVEVARILPPSERGDTPWVKAFIDVDLALLQDDPNLSFAIYDGDVITVLPVPEDFRDYVVVRGAVWNEGRQQWREGLTLTDAIERAGGLREEAFMNRVEVIRTNPDETTTQISRVLSEAVAGAGDSNFLLARRDSVRVYSIHDIYPAKYVTIYGEVQEPGQYTLHQNMTVSDLLTRAGGLTKEAWTNWVTVVSMRLADDGSLAEFRERSVPIDTTYSPLNDQSHYLQDFDQVFVRRRPQWEESRNIAVAGEVLFPGTYSLRFDGERIVEVIERAGGLTQLAYPEGTRFYREFEDAGRINIDLPRALGNSSSDHNLVMQPGDSLYVPPRVSFVTVRGQVGYPSSVMYVRGKKPGYYISQAGGFAEGADRKRVVVTLPNGSTWRPNWFLLPDPEVEPGSLVFVPIRAETERSTWEVIRDTAALLSSFTTVLLLIWQISR